MISNDMIEVRNQLKKKLSCKRYEHTLGVMYTCASLAMKYDYDINKAMWAGLLHDCAKEYSDERMLEKCDRYNIQVTDAERKAPFLLHGKLGAYYAKEKYGIEDEEILDAIRYHTTGKPGMGKLHCILFIADYIEPGRKKVKGINEVRAASYNESLTKAVLLKLSHVSAYLNDTSKAIDDVTMKTYDYFKQEELKNEQ